MKSTLSRKQREVKEREGRILELAQQMIVQDGYHGLSMDRIAEALEYSKGTIYQHFSSKEDILMALVNQAMECRLGLFRRAAAFRGRSRERITAIGAAAELFFQLYPDHFHIEHAVRITSINQKVSEQRRRCLERCEASCSEVVLGVINDGVASGDLVLDGELDAGQVGFGLWSLTFGGYSIAATSPSLRNLGIHDPIVAIRNNCNCLLDALGWKPLAKDLDLPALMKRIQSEVFAPELVELTVRTTRGA